MVKYGEECFVLEQWQARQVCVINLRRMDLLRCAHPLTSPLHLSPFGESGARLPQPSRGLGRSVREKGSGGNFNRICNRARVKLGDTKCLGMRHPAPTTGALALPVSLSSGHLWNPMPALSLTLSLLCTAFPSSFGCTRLASPVLHHGH